MHEIRVSTMSPEEALAGVAELWVDGTRSPTPSLRTAI